MILSVGYRENSKNAISHRLEYLEDKCDYKMAEYGKRRVVLAETKNIHDRFLVVDDDVYHIGASLKDLGKL